MSNSYFQFKQFIVHQDRCAMKVCTDACILGAWFAAKAPPWSQVLDIGSGSGLLMLMLAQKLKGDILGIELDLSAYSQGRENLAGSPWKERFRLFPGDARKFSFRSPFDFIIANPPFYEGDLEAATGPENLARHSKELSLSDLIGTIDRNLTGSGSFGVLLPFHRKDYFIGLAAERQFHLQETLFLRQTPKHDPFRAILHFSRNPEGFAPSSELWIKNDRGEDSAEFVELMREYYLYL
ncbi:MAG: methyltransferase [Bacteroidota bacterium]|nr:methyltransferase [Bacteroidota bacterium]MDP4245015.1 methyltransferase [Bacteroidota bacterium]MDP4259132.1 methyltransferase [Bacteroidota bacterium]